MGLRRKQQMQVVNDAPPSFMDRLMNRIKQAAKVVAPKSGEKQVGRVAPIIIRRRQDRRLPGQLVTRRTSPKFFGTFSPVRPFAKIAVKKWTVPVKAKRITSAYVARVRHMPLRNGFLSVLPVMFGFRKNERGVR